MTLDRIARDQVFPRSRALAAGIGPDELRRLLKSGACQRLHHGWFTTSSTEDPEELHRLRVTALVEQYAGKAVASHASALLRLGLPTFEPDHDTAHLMTTGRGPGHRNASLVVHPRLAPAADQPPLPDTVAGTVHPAIAAATAGLSDLRVFLVPADGALAKGLVTRADLTQAVTLLTGQPGVHHARAGIALVDERHESAGETLAHLLLRQLGYDLVPQWTVPGTQSWTRAGEGYRADFGIRRTGVLVEVDGKVKYTTRKDLWDEKQREDRIRQLGYEVVRLTMADLHDPARVRSLVEAALQRWRRRYGSIEAAAAELRIPG